MLRCLLVKSGDFLELGHPNVPGALVVAHENPARVISWAEGAVHGRHTVNELVKENWVEKGYTVTRKGEGSTNAYRR